MLKETAQPPFEQIEAERLVVPIQVVRDSEEHVYVVDGDDGREQFVFRAPDLGGKSTVHIDAQDYVDNLLELLGRQRSIRAGKKARD